MPQPAPETRSTSDLLSRIRADIGGGQYRAGSFLPSVRQLARRHDVSPETVRRGLTMLSREGLLEVRPRRGFLVRGPRDLPSHHPVAYVTQYRQDLSDAQPVNWAIDRALTAAAGAQGRGMLGLHVAGMQAAHLGKQLSAARAWGIVLDTLDPAMAETVGGIGLPVVMINAWLETAGFNVVLQDNYLGGYLAARHLAENGARRIAWVNPVGTYCHSRERFAGAVAGLAACGRSFAPRDILDTGGDTMNEAQAARLLALLRGKDRPDALLVFWRDIARVVRGVLHAAGLRIGRDLQLVGWCVDELYAREHCALYEGVPAPPAITWKARAMAHAALERLNELRADVSGEPRRVLVPAALRFS